jgi:hypothetical protein
MAAYSALLDRAIAAIVAVKDQKDLDSLFTGRTTTALSGRVAGLEDFELVAFIAVQDVA